MFQNDALLCEEKEQEKKTKKERFEILKYEVLAVVKRAMQLTKYEPRDVQMLAVLLLLAKKEDKGRLAQVFTGEGKSLMIAVLSAIKVIGGDKVDIVAISEVLAKRDSEEFTD